MPKIKQVAQLWQTPRELVDFEGVGQFDAKFRLNGIRFVPMFMDR